MEELTPMMKQYYEIKANNQDAILFFRLGDFYEMFGEDAKTASEELDLMLTTRDRSKENKDERIPMCGIPYHSSEAYIARLIAKGYKVAICEQMEDPATAKGLVDRDIIRIVTPGTLIETSMLDEGKSNYLCSVCLVGDGAAVSFAELSTGEISVTEFPNQDMSHIMNEISTYQPAEAVINLKAGEVGELLSFLTDKMSCLTQTCQALFVPDKCTAIIAKQFADKQELTNAGILAVGGLLSYMEETQKTDLSHINALRINTGGVFMELDVQTVRSLELIASMRTLEKKGSLLWTIDKTKTAMGRRLIRSWVLHPLLSPTQIGKRLNAVNELYTDSVCRGELADSLRKIGDIERLIGKIVYGTAGGRDMRAMYASLCHVPEVVHLISQKTSNLMKEIKRMDMLEDIRDLIGETICDDPPFSIREGGFIRAGFNERVDYLRGLLQNSTAALAAIEAREKERTGKKLKIGYNKVFGYYIEIPRSMSEDVPDDYIRKQTLVNGERFITEELKNLETELTGAKDGLAELEYDLFCELREKIAKSVTRIQDTAAKIATLDAVFSLAETAAQNNYCMPEIDLSGTIDIKAGRHPVVEVMQKDQLFVPNDTYLNLTTDRTAIITGPNMAGKSTYMRQTALIVLLAQMGSFVPAKSARIGIVDRVFTRIGASDDLASGLSTFMVEMTEVAEILENATQKSLLILDEIGRGTSTYDGMSIARAVLEYCADKKTLGAKTLFATHYHELTVMEDTGLGIKNYNITAKKRGKDVIFLRKIVPGGADDSYGIEVAGLAGVPDTVIHRAKAVLNQLEQENAKPAMKASEIIMAEDDQISFGDVIEDEITQTLLETDLNTVTPIEALNILYSLKKKVSDDR